MTKVLITGAGIVSAIGNNKQECLDALIHERSGVGEVRYLRTSHKEFPVGEVKLSNEEMKSRLGITSDVHYSRTELMGILSLKEALEEAKLQEDELALICGTTVAGMDIIEEFYPAKMTKEILDRHDCGANTDVIADYFGCFDFTSTISTACSSATNAFRLGELLIQSGRKDVVVVGGSESLSRFHLNGFKSLMILDQTVCRPFDASRKGLNLGEGAAWMILESEEHAKKRNAPILAELKATGNACDAFHQTASSDDGEGAYLAMMQALSEAGLKASEIDYVNAHGTGTENNDASESAALRRVFGEAVPPVSSTKGFTGHTTSVSGSIEAVFCLLALQHQFLPKNLNFKTADENCILPCVDTTVTTPLKNILCNGFGFGGNDSTLIIGKYGE